MRNLTTVLVVSSGLNLFLVVACCLRFDHQAGVVPSPAQMTSALPTIPRLVHRITTNIVVFAGTSKLLDWSAVESADYKCYIANLRAIGCPEKTIRDIIVADVNQLYQQRFLQDFPPTNRIEYWKPGDALAGVINETQVARLQEFAKSKCELISALLGTDYSTEVELASIQTKVFMERLLNFLTPEKRNALEELERKFTAKTLNTIKDSVRGNNQSSKTVLGEKDEEILKILSPEEKFEYDLRRSDASMILRVGLGDFEVTEQEFRDVFPAMKRFIAEAGMPSFFALIRGEGDPREETLVARQDLLKSLKSALSEKRFGELTEGTGWSLSGE
jgi:hypothetical protein